MNQSPIFGTEGTHISDLIKGCMSPVSRKYGRGDIIMHSGDENDEIGFVDSGTVCLVSISLDGQKSIIEYYCENDIFGGVMSPVSDLCGYYLTAKSKCSITFVSYAKLIACCRRCCETHIGLIDRFAASTVRKANVHIDILGQRSIRGKLVYFFDMLMKQSGSKHIKLPLSLTDLADYLSVDRSAMMREIKSMNDEGMISSKGRDVVILK